jgi:hypothetical protein
MDSQKVHPAAPASDRIVRDQSGRPVVAGLFIHRLPAEQAVHDLQAAGFPGNQISVAVRTGEGAAVGDGGTKAGEGAAAGVVGGGVLGGLAGFLVGIGALTIPGVGPVIAGGALASALGTAAGAGIGAAAGGLIGTLAGMGIPETDARHFEAGLRSGSTLVIVNAGERKS